ncbi:GFA family protein [Mariluticola halotolerans]|uniref:GFA family protein n=1 Tax=Mariluticola halotolerans TaxID=2909283 RepID=UPI0026E39D89|nr:GFA family protein [Mariluticola halotolerans]UJQ95392.1 GFA family protein [Mariluticola halotolerans]
MTLTGQCHCGAVHFSVEGEPVRMAQCHCNTCRRLTGTGHNVQAFFKKDQVEITGETRSYQNETDMGNQRTTQFCAACGSRLFSENSRNPTVIGIAAGAFDTSEWFKPQVILYNAERPIWDVIDPTIELHEMM